MADDISTNLGEQNALLKEQNVLFGAQLGLSQDLVRVLESRARAYSKATTAGKNASDAAASSLDSFEQGAKRAGGQFDMLQGQIGGFAAAFSGFINSPEITAAYDLYNQFYTHVATLGEEVLKIQQKIFHANEAIRGSFGDLSYGKFFNEVMGGFGNLINTITISNKELFGELTVSLVKGAGLSNKALGGLGALTKKTGKSIEQTMGFVNERIATLSSQTGVSAKFIGKNLSAMLEDLGTFGHRTEAELVNLAATTAMLGVEMSDLQGIANKFDQFDTAAESVAKLNRNLMQ
jgi:hypothetical protein